MRSVHYKKNSRQRRGFSLVIIMILLFSFLIAYPLISRQVDDGQRLAESFERWTQLQVARDSALQIIASTTTSLSTQTFETLQATYSYTIGANSSFSIALTGYIETVTNTPRFARASATAFVEHSNPTKYYNAGFQVGSVNASFSYIAPSKNTASGAYAFWEQIP